MEEPATEKTMEESAGEMRRHAFQSAPLSPPRLDGVSAPRRRFDAETNQAALRFDRFFVRHSSRGFPTPMTMIPQVYIRFV
ncbi:hypothetical protein U1Q18_019761 [Sarracenia purpurea var. burkii]